MIKVSYKHKYMDITSNGFIVLYNDLQNQRSIGDATILSTDLIYVQTVSFYYQTDFSMIYNRGNYLGVLSVNMLMERFNNLTKACKKDLLDYDYIKIDNYIYKIPKNNLILLSCLSTSESKNQLLLSHLMIKTEMVQDCCLLIIPLLMDLIRLDYDNYIY